MGNSKLDAATEFADNPDPRCACVVLLDTSGSMQGERIEGLNQGLRTLKEELLKDDLAMKRVDLLIMTFNSEMEVIRDFGPLADFEVPVLTAASQTFMGTAVSEALNKIETRKKEYRDNGVQHYRPWLFFLTDGRPEGEAPEVTEAARERLRIAQEQKRVKVFPVAVGDEVNLAELGRFAGTEALRLEKLNFRELFVWLSASLSVVSHSQDVGAQVSLPPPGWRSA